MKKYVLGNNHYVRLMGKFVVNIYEKHMRGVNFLLKFPQMILLEGDSNVFKTNQ